MIALAIAAVVVSVSSVVAYMVKRTQQLDNQFIPAQVQCTVKEEFESDIKTSVKVQNTGNIEAYVRLRIVTYWQDSKGNTVGLTAPEIKFGGDWKYDTDNWIYDETEKTTWWGEIDPWLTDVLYLHPKFKTYFDERSGEATYGIYPTVTIRQIMWALKMKPIVKERWETCFDRRDI